MKAFLLIGILAVTLSSCSGSPAPTSEDPTPTVSGKALTSSDCQPLAFPSTDDPAANLEEGHLITSSALDLFIDATEEDATTCANSMGLVVRIASRDGEDYMLTMDYSSSRVNFTVENQIVTAATVG